MRQLPNNTDTPATARGVVLAQETDALVELTIDAGLYSEDVVLRVAYWFTDRCYVHLQRVDGERLLVRFSRGEDPQPLANIIGEFTNELVNQRLRDTIARETATIRELIVAQAFAEGEFASSPRDEKRTFPRPL